MTATSSISATEVVAAIEDTGEPGIALRLAEELARRAGLPLRSVHVEADPSETTDQDLVRAISDRLDSGSILVVRTDHASRWSGKYSVAEHVIDRWGGPTVVVGPSGRWEGRTGPVLVAVNGSAGAERAIAPAQSLASLFSVGVLFATVIADDDDDSRRRTAQAYLDSLPAGPGHETCLLSANDHVAALVAEAEARSSPFIALASRGDRTVTRPTISRTSSGLANEASCPVLIVGDA